MHGAMHAAGIWRGTVPAAIDKNERQRYGVRARIHILGQEDQGGNNGYAGAK